MLNQKLFYSRQYYNAKLIDNIIISILSYIKFFWELF